jgi:hypothetical protein
LRFAEKYLPKTKHNSLKHQIIKDYLKKRYAKLIRQYENKKSFVVNRVEHDFPIFCFWWQGEYDMPDIIKACYTSICKHANGNTVTLITKDNYGEYIELPDHILSKVNANIISLTHLSDIVRMCLLYEHGGLYLDMAILLTSELYVPKYNIEHGFYTLREDSTDNWNVSENRWCGFFIYMSKQNIISEFAMNFFLEYWKNHNKLIDYFLIDYAIAVAYETIPAVKILIDSVRNKCKVHRLQKELKSKFYNTAFQQICANTNIHKLTYKDNFHEYDTDNVLTNYGYIIQKYGSL